VTVKAVPADAAIYINNQQTGRGAHSADYAAGSELALRIAREGYEEFTGTVKVPNAAAAPFEYSLKQRMVGVTIRSNPADAAIYINGQAQGRGAFSADYAVGADLVVRITRDGYEDFTGSIKAAEGAAPFEFALKARLIEYRVKTGGQRLVGAVSVEGGTIVAADRRGTLYAVSAAGNVLWNLVTSNTPNENSFPTIWQKRVYFSGGKEFVIVNLDNGAAVYRTTLDTASSHLFGRRAMPSGLGVLFPVNNAVQVLEPESGRQTGSIPIPGGSQMSPVIYKGSMLIADQQGTLLMLNPATGMVEYSGATTAIQPLSHPVTVVQDKAVFSGRKGSVVCFDLAGRKLVWQRELNAKTPPVADIAASERAIYVYADQAIRALSLNSGEDLFPAIKNSTSAPLLQQGRLYFGRNDGLAVADAQSGRILATIKVPGGVSARPAVVDGRIFAASADGEVLIINPRSVLR
jgi:outer membrane protein assembly factor BamB